MGHWGGGAALRGGGELGEQRAWRWSEQRGVGKRWKRATEGEVARIGDGRRTAVGGAARSTGAAGGGQARRAGGARAGRRGGGGAGEEGERRGVSGRDPRERGPQGEGGAPVDRELEGALARGSRGA
ncbi:hypothetical protein BRADI_2g30060v3 [Brachypodium distachyon]|uniref:Uncharacterized protein n=1 Tax=Brachypodium distachyon TaxID=15368 RepID=A0A2K2DB69_BRADI|nr:hypothetical protein BRADI_2g30060v3 [Brachypodium distachyon]